jgi:hypothetical protein
MTHSLQGFEIRHFMDRDTLNDARQCVVTTYDLPSLQSLLTNPMPARTPRI